MKINSPKNTKLKIRLWVFLSGFIFSLGLGISGMMNPEKVLGFLNIFGKWDPSLVFVMGGALLVTFFTLPKIGQWKNNLCGGQIYMPSKKDIDMKLIFGSCLFGIGWGISGFCPGPALANLLTLTPTVILFLCSMLFGMGLFSFVMKLKK